MVGRVTSGLMVLGSKESRLSSKEAPFYGLCISFCLQVPTWFERLFWLPSMDCESGHESQTKPFSPQVAFGHGVSSQQ